MQMLTCQQQASKVNTRQFWWNAMECSVSECDPMGLKCQKYDISTIQICINVQTFTTLWTDNWKLLNNTTALAKPNRSSQYNENNPPLFETHKPLQYPLNGCLTLTDHHYHHTTITTIISLNCTVITLSEVEKSQAQIFTSSAAWSC